MSTYEVSERASHSCASSKLSALGSRLSAVLLLASAPAVAAAQSSVTVSPFGSYIPSAATNPLAGFGITFGGTTGLALRGSGQVSLKTPDTSVTPGSNRPWGADADVMLFLGGLGGGATVFDRRLSPYVFSGIGLFGDDSAGTSVVRDGWSYGLGTTIPLGLHADLFGEARWRMPEYVLPTSNNAPDSKSEMRFGLSFHVGGPEPARRYPPPRRRHRDTYYDEEEVVAAPAPAPAPQVVVVQPAPAPPPPQVVVIQQPAPEPRRRVSINVPIIITPSRSRRSRHEVTRVVQVVKPVTDTVYVVPSEAARPRRRP